MLRTFSHWGFLVCGLLLLSSTDARMYQWLNPKTGVVQFSGNPPSWYRAPHGSGSRVLVYDNGKLIDDTSIPLPPERSQAIRKEAFRKVDERQQLQALRKLEQASRWRVEPRREPETGEREAEGKAPTRSESPEETLQQTQQLGKEMLTIYEKYLQRLAAAAEQSEGNPGTAATGPDVSRAPAVEDSAATSPR